MSARRVIIGCISQDMICNGILAWRLSRNDNGTEVLESIGSDKLFWRICHQGDTWVCHETGHRSEYKTRESEAHILPNYSNMPWVPPEYILLHLNDQKLKPGPGVLYVTFNGDDNQASINNPDIFTPSRQRVGNWYIDVRSNVDAAFHCSFMSWKRMTPIPLVTRRMI